MQNDIHQVLEFMKNHKFVDAIKSLDNIILNNQQNVESYNLRAICYLQLSQYEKAKNDFDKVLSLKPNVPEVYNNLGILNFRLGQNNLVVTNFLKSIEINNNFEEAIFGLIKTLSHSKDIAEKLNIYLKHNELNKIKINYSEKNILKMLI